MRQSLAGAVGGGSAIPPELARLMRPELGILAKEIVHEIRLTIPEYSGPLDGPYGQAIIQGVEQAITSFVNQIADPSTPKGSRDEICRQLGRYEVLEGRSLDTLQAAYRIGARVAWQRLMRFGRRYELSSPVMARLAEAVFAYMDELAGLSFEGYVQAKSRTAGAVEQWGRRLLNLLLQQPPAPADAITELTQALGWRPPDTVTMVAVQQSDAGDPCSRVTITDLRALHHGILAELDGPHPHLLLPEQFPVVRYDEFARMFPGRLIAIGPPVALGSAAASLRWAQQTLALMESSVIAEGPVVHASRHLATLLLGLDPELIEAMARKRLVSLREFAPKQRQRLAETLLAWLSTGGSAPEIASLLDVHPQTVRYRMRQLEKAFGPALADPQARFEMELVLRAQQLFTPAGN